MPTFSPPLPRDMLGVDDSVQPKLTRHEEPDIAQLMPKVERAMREYAICKVRLDAEQAPLSHTFSRRMGRQLRRSGLALRTVQAATEMGAPGTAATR